LGLNAYHIRKEGASLGKGGSLQAKKEYRDRIIDYLCIRVGRRKEGGCGVERVGRTFKKKGSYWIRNGTTLFKSKRKREGDGKRYH